jgi:hypothetical protein
VSLNQIMMALARISQTTECRTVRRVAAGIVYTPAA